MTLLLVALAYLVGSIPSAVLVARAAAGVDIRTVGSGVAGISNVYTQIGPLPGVVVAVLDLGKGALAVALLIASGAGPAAVGSGAAAVVLGHWWPVFAGFRGGVGAGPAVGATIVLAPAVFLVAGPLAGLALLISRRGRVAGATALAGAVLASLVLDGPSATTATLAVLGALVLVRMLTWRGPSGQQAREDDGRDATAESSGDDPER